MRLTDTQSATIREEVQRHFGDSARALLFGSRVRDDALGGDIDLFVEAEGNAEQALTREPQIYAALQRRLGERRIDIIVHQLRVVEQKNIYRQRVIQRFFPRQDMISPVWPENLLSTPEGIDCMESFVGKFSRMQDTVDDKLLPLLLTTRAEKSPPQSTTLTVPSARVAENWRASSPPNC